MENCDVCCEKFNKINHKKVECPFCDLQSCRTCSKRYLLSISDDPHCMGCKNTWNREFVDTWCTKYFRNTELRRHRENILFEREKVRMPETQPEVERIRAMRKLYDIIQEQRKRLLELYQKYGLYNGHPTISEIPEPIQELRFEMEETYRELERLRHGGELVVGEEPKKFVRKCPTEECKGFMNEDWFCGLCDRHFCEQCNEEVCEDHICDSDAVKTMKLLKKDTKPCPKCGTMIQKLSGCRQMWCPDCHTAFDWISGQIEMGRIHNPHYMEFKRGHISSREHGDIPCGGVPSFRELREILASNEILRCAVIIHDVERENIYLDLRPIDNLHFRVAYMLNDVDEVYFKHHLQCQEKYLEKMRDISNIFEMMANSGGDLLRQYVLEPERHDEIVDMIHEIVDYGNDIFETIRKRYTCKTPRNIYI